MTKGLLQPDHHTSNLELLLRVFIEAIAEQWRLYQLNSMKDEEGMSDDSLGLREIGLGAHLLFHLQLDPYHPIVSLAVKRAISTFRCCFGRPNLPDFEHDNLRRTYLAKTLKQSTNHFGSRRCSDGSSIRRRCCFQEPTTGFFLRETPCEYGCGDEEEAR